ncbi:hypothetical protein BXT86_06800 [candidate division WOR-3 bacterium 4484_100]|uniref:Glycosyltransferase RgtA/B/C/D-like domain-containing protein n=1 Tax=candidate division WOR-3 bacterium 4484_100 TaxID=1936077 RepID=A0A1V4QDB7_UNCW3|nr:MAG: hypothetical protein BXT86_06800 [candidate division WOR-3 bacterium 4484_100]
MAKRSKGFSKKNRLLLSFLLGYLFISLLLFDPKLFTGGDNAVYVLLAQSITSGKGYRNIYLPDEPAHTQYPFGFPLLLCLPLLIFKNIIFLKFLIVLLGLGAFFFFYRIVEYLFKENYEFIIPFYLFIPIFIIYNHWLLSEIPFLFFSLGALYFMVRAEQEKKSLYIPGFILASYAFFIRSAGISLIIGIALYLIVKKRYQELIIFLIIFGVAFIPWQLRNMKLSAGGSYLDQLLAKNPYQLELGRATIFDLIARGWNNAIFYAFTILPLTIVPLIGLKFLLVLFGIFFTGLIIVGFIQNIKRWSILEFYLLLAVVVLLGWPRVWSSDRFLLPVLPLLLIYIFYGLKSLSKRFKFRYLPQSLVGFIVLLNIIHLIPLIGKTVENNLAYLRGDKYAGYTQDWKRYFEVIEWIKKKVPEDKIIMARKPEFVYLLSGRKSRLYPFTRNHQKIRNAIEECDYIIFDNFYWSQSTRRYLAPVLQETIGRYKIAYKTPRPEFYLLKILKPLNP